MERGVLFGHSLQGYDVQNGKLTKYGVEGKGTGVIARELLENGYCTRTGNPYWNVCHIIIILRNEKYVGDLVQKKSYRPNYLTHQKKYNHGAEELICLTDHHEPIISRELWNRVQSELSRRNRHGQIGFGHGNRYLFSGKIRCGLCGKSFFSRDITREEMRLMNERYDRRLSELQTALCSAREREQLSYETETQPSDIAAHIAFLDACDRDELYYRSLLNSMNVYPDRRVVIRLNLLPEKWRFVLDSLADMRLRTGDKGCQYDPSVPISVKSPFSSSKGMA